ncbi:Cell wall / vacuolar inhibitor of fructosidase 2 [Linum grandiflorum]
MDSHTSLLLPLLLLLLSAAAASAAVIRPEFAKEVCNQTSDYKLCLDVLYTDPRTPGADRPSIADIVARLAFQNATGMRQYLTSIKGTGGGLVGLSRVKICRSDYEIAVKKMEMALNDLNSESYYSLVHYARVSAGAARHCQAVFSKSAWQPLGNRTHIFLVLCEAVAFVGNWFTGGGDMIRIGGEKL